MSTITIPGASPSPGSEDVALRAWQDSANGWAHYADGSYLVGSPLALTGGVRAVLENDGTGGTSETGYLPAGSTALWDVVGDRITPDAVGDCYDLRIGFTIDPASVNSIISLHLDIGSDPLGASSIVVVDRTQSLTKGAVPQAVVIAFPVFCLATFKANGGQINIECDSNADVYNITILLVKQASGTAVPA